MSSKRVEKLDVQQVNITSLDTILMKMVDTVTESKGQIFDIGEKSRKEYELLIKELHKVKSEVVETITKNDRLEKQSAFARSRLAEVSKHFDNYGEKAIRSVYEYANRIQVELSISRQTEKQLRSKRNDLERRLAGLKDTVEQSDSLVGQVSVVLDYLNGDLRQIGEMVEDAKQKQAFGLKIIEAQEEERRRLSRDIHDGPAQMLAHVLLGSDLVERLHKEKGEKEAFQELDNLREMIRKALYEVRRIIYDLRPMTLDDLGLVPTLEKFLHRTEEHEKTLITFQKVGVERRFPAKMEVSLYRLIQEAVQNAHKHAEATEIEVKIEYKSDFFSIVVKDNGKGFDQEIEKEGAFGLIGMKERVELLEGKMTIDSKLKQGTVIMIQIPVH